MGLIQEVQALRMDYKNSQEELLKAQKEIARLKAKIENNKEKEKSLKQYDRDIKKAVENDLRKTFERCFERDGLEKGYINLTLKVTRDEILKNVAESSTEVEYMDKIYETTLNKVKKIYENDQKAKNTLKQIELHPKLIEEQKKQQKYNILKTISLSIFNVVKWVFAGVFILICIILKDASKKE